MERHARIALWASFGLAFLLAAPSRAEEGATHTDRLIVKYRSAAARTAAIKPPRTAAINPLTRALGVTRFVRETATGATVLQLATPMPLAEVAALAHTIARDADVEYAEPDRVMQTTAAPDDPFYGAQWSLFEARGGINLAPAWALTHGAASVTVAVLDTGIRPHEDLPRLLPGYDFVADPARGNDGDGRDGDPSDPGDWVTYAESQQGPFAGCRVRSSSWHGTHVAGIIGAQGNNGKGVAGINWESPILPVRVLGKCGGYNSDVVDAMYWAAGFSVPGVPENAHPARVLNLSLGGSAERCPFSYQEAVDTLTAAGVVIVVSAGNGGTDSARTTPANCAGVVAVAASDRAGERAWYSNYGAGVTLAAPGGAQFYHNDPEGVWSTLNDGTAAPGADAYRGYQGTSMAAPQVAGAVSLMLAVEPTLDAAAIADILRRTARAFPVGGFCAGEAGRCGAGLLDVGKAVESVAERRAAAERAAAEQAAAEASAIANGGGGGGCTLVRSGTGLASAADPLLLLLVVISLLVLARRPIRP